MRKVFSGILYSLLTAAVVAAACYALGLFGGDEVRYVRQKEYAEQSFAFTGALVGGKFDGQCEIVFDDGSVYEGDISDGRFSGDGSFKSADGWSFDGMFSEGFAVDGMFFLESGETISFRQNDFAGVIAAGDWTYSGTFGELGQHGSGTFVFADGSVYSGGFAYGFADGEGEYSDASGRLIYKGGFLSGLYDGQGAYYSRDGWSYEGGFKNGLFDGPGVVTDRAGVTSGVWERGTQLQ